MGKEERKVVKSTNLINNMDLDENVLLEFHPHTHAKHEILRRYIAAWMPILTIGGFHGRILYIDGFAGSGQYKDSDELGSPQIALDSVLGNKVFDKIKSEIGMIFIEANGKRAEHLKSILDLKYKLPKNVRYYVIQEEFNKEMNNLLEDLDKENKRLAPTFCFVDPYGWSDLDYDVLARFMKEKKAELFITFMVGFLSRFTSDERLISIKKLFSEEQLATIDGATEKHLTISTIFLNNLKSKISTLDPDKKIYALSFRTIDQHNNTMYYLLYLTSHHKGFEVMKEAMFEVGKGDKYLFSDYDFNPNQRSIMDYTDETIWAKEAGEEIHNKLLNKTMSGKEVRSYVILNTKWIYRGSILKYLEEKKKIVVSDRTRQYTYPKGCKITFV